MTDWSALGAEVGRAIAALIPEAAAERLRARYAAKNGVCRTCQQPLAGPSPEQICEECHTDERLGEALGTKGKVPPNA